MPVVRFRVDRLLEYSGISDLDEIRDLLFKLKCEAEEVEAGILEVEVNPDRPDMYISDGIVRMLRGLKGIEKGWSTPYTIESGVKVYSRNPSPRPYIAAIVLYNVDVDNDYIEELIQFQEKLHDTIGRRRRKIAIGIHDLDKMPGYNLEYTLAKLDTRMKPLGLDAYKTIRWVLEHTEQGVKYGSISRSDSWHPILLANGEPIAIPPVLNSDVTRIEPGTKNIFVDVTGTDANLVDEVAELIASTLAYRSGIRVGLVEVIRDGSPIKMPQLPIKTMDVSINYINKVLGTRLSSEDAARLLEKMRYNVVVDGEDTLKVMIPPFRVDILGEIDIVEDIAIAAGYDELEPRKPERLMRGELKESTLLSRVIRKLMIGLGYTEVMQLTLTSPKYISALGLEDEAVLVANPVQQDYSVLRPSLLVTLLPLLKANTHREKPVRVFEIGWVVKRQSDAVIEDLRLAVGIMDEEVSYEDIQAPIYSLLRLLNVTFNVEPGRVKGYIEGRTGIIKSGGDVVGWLGEIHPGILEKLGLEYPVAVAELSIIRLNSKIKGQS